MTRVLITGASGFVGGLVRERLEPSSMPVAIAVRRASPLLSANTNVRQIIIDNIGPETDWREALSGCDTIVHMAGQVPAVGTNADTYRLVNDRGTARLATQAVEVGIRRFIFMSSIFVIREHSSDVLVDDSAQPAPSNPYAESKLHAERHVAALGDEGIEWIVLRPPIIYGAGAGGNWRALQKLAASPLPLPFASVTNRRTMLAADNVTDALAHLVKFDSAAWRSGTYVIADKESVSLAETLRLLREGMGRSVRLVPAPVGAMSAALHALGKGTIAQSLLSNLEVDASRFRDTFGWHAPHSAQEAIRKSGREFVRAGRD